MRKNILVLSAIFFLTATLLFSTGNYWVKTVPITLTTDTTATSSSVVTKIIGLTPQAYKIASPSITAQAVVPASNVTLRGLGNVDTCDIVLYTKRLGVTRSLDSTHCNSLPCTAFVSIDSTMDTLIWSNLYWWIRIADSTSDSVFSAGYNFHHETILKGY